MDGEIPDFEKKLIANHFTLEKHRKNAILISDREDCDKMYFVLKGVIRIFYFNKHNTEITRTFVFENEFCTNLISFSKQGENTENIQCLEDCLLYSITRENFYKMMKESHVMTHLYTKVLEKFIKYNLERFQFISTLNQRERVEKFLSDFPEANRRIKDKIIATYLGISPEFFSKIKSEFYKK